MTERTIWTKNFVLITIANGLLFVNFHCLVPTIAMYAASLGASGSEIGIIAGIFAFSAILVRLFTDAFVQRLGKRGCLVLGLFLSLSATVSYGMFTNFHALLLARIVHGFGFCLSTTFAAALAVDVIPLRHRGEGLGYFGLGNTVSMGAAPAIGVAVFSNVNAVALFAMSAGAALLSLLLFRCVSGSQKEEKSSLAETARKKLPLPLKNRLYEKGTGIISLFAVLFGFVFASVNTYLPLMAQEKGIPYSGFFFLIGTLFTFLSRLFGGKLYDRRGPFSVIIPGLLIYSVFLLLLLSASSAAMLLFSSAFFGLGAGLVMPSVMTWLFNTAAPERRSNAGATYYNMLDLGTCTGIIVLGAAAGAVGYVVIFKYVLAVMAFYLIFALWVYKRWRER